jgi:hypothetical protein
MCDVVRPCLDVVHYMEVNEAVLPFGHFHGPLFWGSSTFSVDG